jgi:sensor histidine kinase regulating citrate/malate metabolism
VFAEGYSTKQRWASRPRGIGLALVAGVARRHRGSVELENRGGALFTVRLPARAPVAAGAAS